MSQSTPEILRFPLQSTNPEKYGKMKNCIFILYLAIHLRAYYTGCPRKMGDLEAFKLGGLEIHK